MKKNINHKSEKPQLEKRKFIIGLGSVVAGSLLIPKALSEIKTKKETISQNDNVILPDIQHRHPIMPPGAINMDNLNRHCSACHLCISRCPEKILKPAKLEYGLKGIMQPTINYNDGFCEYDCIECLRVCPTGAIRPMKEDNHNKQNHNEIYHIKEKQRIQIGIARYRNDYCQVNSMKINCGKCAFDCPTGAISMVNNTKNKEQSNTKNNLLVPLIDESKCIGCGACEYYCPTSLEKKAIWVDGLKEHKKIV